MPLPLQNIYTGTGSDLTIRAGDKLDRAQQIAGQQFNRISDIQYKDALRRQDELLEASKITPEQYLNDTFMDQQAAYIAAFEDEWTNLYRDKEGNLSTMDLMDLQRKKNDLISKQADMLAKDAMVKEQMQAYYKNPEDYDRNKTLGNIQMYRQGKLPEGKSVLEFAPLDLDKEMAQWYRDQRYRMSQDTKRTLNNDGTIRYTTVTESYPPIEEQRQDLLASFYNKPKWMEDAKKGYMDLTEEEQGQYEQLAQSKGTQPVFEYFYNKVSPMMRGVASTDTKTEELEERGGGLSFNFGGGQSRDKRSTYEIVENLDTANMGEGWGIRFTNSKSIKIPTSVFDWPDGYEVAGKNIDFKPTNIKDDMVEGEVNLEGGKITVWVEATEEEYNSLPPTDATEKDGKYYKKVKLPSEITLPVDLFKIKDELSTVYDDLDDNLKKLKELTPKTKETLMPAYMRGGKTKAKAIEKVRVGTEIDIGL